MFRQSLCAKPVQLINDAGPPSRTRSGLPFASAYETTPPRSVFCKDTVLKISLQRCHLHAPHKARSSAIKLHPADEREAACQLVFRRPILGRSFLSINEILPRNYDYKLQKKREEEEALRTFMWTNLFLEASVLSVSGPGFCFIFYFSRMRFLLNLY